SLRKAVQRGFSWSAGVLADPVEAHAPGQTPLLVREAGLAPTQLCSLQAYLPPMSSLSEQAAHPRLEGPMTAIREMTPRLDLLRSARPKAGAEGHKVWPVGRLWAWSPVEPEGWRLAGSVT